MGSSSFSGKGSSSTPSSYSGKGSFSGKGSSSKFSGKGSYSGKCSSTDYELEAIEEEMIQTQNNKNISAMRKMLELLEKVEACQTEVSVQEMNLKKAKHALKKAEDAVRRQLQKLDPETRARFSLMFGEGPGGEDR